MTDYNILVSQVPRGGRAVANITAKDVDSPSDVDSVRAVWKDQLGATLSDETYTVSDISDTDTYGNAVTLTNPSGTGTYQATLVVDGTSQYTIPTNGSLQWSLTVTIVKGIYTQTNTFYYRIVNSNLTVSLDQFTISRVVKRGLGLLKDISLHGQKAQLGGGSTLVYLDLGNDLVYSIDVAYKNGVQFLQGTSGDTYEWKLYRPYVKVNTAALSTDHYVFRIQTRMSDDAIQDYIDEAMQYVFSRLKGHYTYAQLNTSPVVLTMVADRCMGRMRKETSEGTALRSGFWRSGADLVDEVDALLKMIQNGAASLFDNNGDTVTRIEGSLIGGFRGSRGAITNRLALIDRLQEYTTIFINFGSENTNLTSSRSF